MSSGGPQIHRYSATARLSTNQVDITNAVTRQIDGKIMLNARLTLRTRWLQIATRVIPTRAIRRSKAVTCATVMRLRRSAISSAFTNSSGQMAGASASVPLASRSRTPSVKLLLSSSKHHATATDASRTIRLITAPFIDQLADGYFPEVHSLAKLANLSNELARILLLTSVGRN